MKRALIACDGAKANEFYRDFLEKHGFLQIYVATDAEEAKRQLAIEDFDICIVSAPLKHDNGIDLAKDIAGRGQCQVILFVRAEVFDEVTEEVLPHGILTVQRPINKQIFHSAILFSAVANERMRTAGARIVALEKRLSEQGVISRAKCVLIAYQKLSEEEAHKYIERHAMDARTSRLEIAREILEYYDED